MPDNATVFLAPASPPSAPHLGIIYTWCLLDAAARAARHLGGTAIVPECWNLSSRRLDDQLAVVDATERQRRYQTWVSDAVASARVTQAQYGISTDPEPAMRDDDPEVRSEIAAVVTALVEEGRIIRTVAPEKWCDPCGIATPAISSILNCFRCQLPLVVHERPDWFLVLAFPTILDQAAATRWLPPYALHRFRDLTDIAPLVRVGHFGRFVGITSPLDPRQMLDPRLVAALYPRVLRARGYLRIVAAAGQDIQRKWLTLVYATTTTEPALDTIINHGVLLADGRTKMSRYDGATPADRPDATDPIAYRAALLSSSLGRDVVASAVPYEDASRLRAKVHNTQRFLAAQLVSSMPDAINLDHELGPALDTVDQHLATIDLQRAYAAFRTAVRAELSHRIIPMIRTRGCQEAGSTLRRLRSTAAVFFGPDA